MNAIKKPITLELGGHEIRGTVLHPFKPDLSASKHRPLGIIQPLPSGARPTTAKPKDRPAIQPQVRKAQLFNSDKVQVKKPVPQQLKNPFLYIQRVVPKSYSLSTLKYSHPDKFYLGSTFNSTRKTKQQKRKLAWHAQGSESLYTLTLKRQDAAYYLFQKLKKVAPEEGKLPKLWVQFVNRQQISIELATQKQFKDFLKFVGLKKTDELMAFFELFCEEAEDPLMRSGKAKVLVMKPFLYNFQKFWKSKVKVVNVLSKVAAKERLANLKLFLEQWRRNYPFLKAMMADLKKTENFYRKQLKELKDGEENPYESQIREFEHELNDPLVKYDKGRKTEYLKRIEALKEKFQSEQQKSNKDYQFLLDNYDRVTKVTHNLFYRKKELAKLLWRFLQTHPAINSDPVFDFIDAARNSQKAITQRLSHILGDFHADKRKLNELDFTLGELCSYFLKSKLSPEELHCSKKLVKVVKRQFIALKNISSEIEEDKFPSDTKVEIDLLQKCFQIYCMQLLFKNEVWNELEEVVGVDPHPGIHELVINSNLVYEAIKHHFHDLDYQLKIQLRQSIEATRLVSEARLNSFSLYGEILKLLLQGESCLDELRAGAPRDQSSPGKELAALSPLANFLVSKPSEYVSDALLKVAYDQVVVSKQKYERAEATMNPNAELLGQVLGKAAEKEKDELKDSEFVSKALGGLELLTSQQFEKRKEQQRRQGVILSIMGEIFSRFSDKNIMSFEEQMREIERRKAAAEQQQQSEEEHLPSRKEIAIEMNALNVANITSYKRQATETLKSLVEMPLSSSSRRSESVLRPNFTMGLSRVEDIPGDDPLRLSKYLKQTIREGMTREEHNSLKGKVLPRDLASAVNSNYYKEKIGLESRNLKFDSEGKATYELLLPYEYYNVATLSEQNNPLLNGHWFLRPHHVETLTEHPFSKKDNQTATKYISKLSKFESRSKEEIEQSETLRRKEELIHELEARVGLLRQELHSRKMQRSTSQAAVPTQVLHEYFKRLTDEGVKGKDLENAAYESLLYDQRKRELALLNEARESRLKKEGFPAQKWWQLKDPSFIEEYVKHRDISTQAKDKVTQQHFEYLGYLKSRQLY